MEPNKFFDSGYSGSKAFTQWDVQIANATGFGAAADDYNGKRNRPERAAYKK